MSRLRTLISGLGYPEAPRWHDGALWLVDYFQAGVFRLPAGAAEPERVATVEGTPGGLGFLPDGTPLVVSQRDFRVLRIGPAGEISLHADASAHAKGALNELLVTPDGRAYAGHHGFDFFGGAAPEPSSLLLIETDGSVRPAAAGQIFPNGTALSPDGRTLVLAESFANKLTAYDVAEDGALSNARTFAEVGEHTPDGLCMDAEGAVWFGSPLTGSFVRVAEGGRVLDEVKTADGRWAVACVLGGPDRRTLYCLTAATTLETMPQEQSQGFVEALEVDVPGAGTP